eukprot:gene5723-9543_t
MNPPYRLSSFKNGEITNIFTDFMNPNDPIHRDSFKMVVNESLYEQLGVSPQATLKEIRTKYYKKIKIYHTDLLPSAKKKEFYSNRCNELNEAYNILSDPKKRAKYDILGLNQDLNLEAEYKDKTAEEMRREIKIQKMCYDKIKRDERIKSQSNIILNLNSKAQIQNINSNFSWRSTLNSNNFINFKASTAFDLNDINKSMIHNKIEFQHNFESSSIKLGSNLNNKKEVSFDLNLGFGSSVDNPSLNINLNSDKIGKIELKKDVQMTQSDHIQFSSNFEMDNSLNHSFNIKTNLLKNLDENNKLGFGISIVNSNEVQCCFNWETGRHLFSIPIPIWEELTFMNVLKTFAVSSTLNFLLSSFFIRPYRRRNLEEIRRENYEINKKNSWKLKQWINEKQMEIYQKMDFEESRRGIVIMNARYGVLNDEYSTEYQGYIDVTQSLQFHVKNSTLELSNFLVEEGFYDPAPGEKKELEVIYKFHGKLHYVIKGDGEVLQMPLSEHLDE